MGLEEGKKYPTVLYTYGGPVVQVTVYMCVCGVCGVCMVCVCVLYVVYVCVCVLGGEQKWNPEAIIFGNVQPVHSQLAKANTYRDCVSFSVSDTRVQSAPSTAAGLGTTRVCCGNGGQPGLS